MVCVTCNKSDHDEDAKYCTHCGTDLFNPLICTCGKYRHLLGAKFCSKCGEELPYWINKHGVIIYNTPRL